MAPRGLAVDQGGSRGPHPLNVPLLASIALRPTRWRFGGGESAATLFEVGSEAVVVQALMMLSRQSDRDGCDAKEGPGAGNCRALFRLGDGVGPRFAGDPILAGGSFLWLRWVWLYPRPRPAFDEAAGGRRPGWPRVVTGEFRLPLPGHLLHPGDVGFLVRFTLTDYVRLLRMPWHVEKSIASTTL